MADKKEITLENAGVNENKQIDTGIFVLLVGIFTIVAAVILTIKRQKKE
ncbi:hypothetical protein G4V62_05620 [Bacillaceae bacterium SIJ1]|nr:hypothetical protein [Litoribacterium kuwaitense]NGP44460.1 hypothetical protein [Litoribacterium kuwaitense]